MRGKREMRRNYTPFVAGMITTVLLIGLISATFAANTDKKDAQPSGGAVPADVSIGMFLKQQIAPGEMLTTEQGGKAPKVLACDDTKGETHYYIEATAVAELFNVTGGVNFHEEANQLEFGAMKIQEFDDDGNLVELWDEYYSPQERMDFLLGTTTDGKTGERIVTGGDIPVTTSSGYVFSSGKADYSQDPERQKEAWAMTKSILSAKPEYGKTLGMYTEVDPAEINLATLSAVDMKGKEFQDAELVEHVFRFSSVFGKYAAITFENTGKAEAEIRVDYLDAVGSGGSAFTGIYLPAGQKITRAFKIDENKPLENQLRIMVKPLGEGGVSVKFTNEQYRSGK